MKAKIRKEGQRENQWNMRRNARKCKYWRT